MYQLMLISSVSYIVRGNLILHNKSKLAMALKLSYEVGKITVIPLPVYLALCVFLFFDLRPVQLCWNTLR